MEKRQYGGRINLVCERCGHRFTRPSSRVKEHAFCSRACYFGSDIPHANAVKANQTKYPAGGMTKLTCLHCAKRFDRYKSQAVSRQSFCSVICKKAYRIAQAEPQAMRGGYVRVFVGAGAPGATASGYIAEHRKVMQEMLGRALVPEENVHHINGVRSDNRSENLELWSVSQPSGQRVADKLAWAKEFVSLYEGLPSTN